MQRTLLVLSACVVLIASGVVHGVWTDRWTDSVDLAAQAHRLDTLPMTIGDWHGTTIEMEQGQRSGMTGMIARRYVHATTGKSVTLLLGCGRSGPVCTHTPDVCYAGSGFEVEKPKRFQLTGTAARTPPEFWTSRFVRERASGKTHLRIFWSWHGSEAWKVADNPRLSFASEKSLHKLYLIREMTTADESMDADACVEFMHELLPAFQSLVRD